MQKFEPSPKPFLDQVEGKFYLEHLKSGKPVLSIWANFEIESCLDSTYIETEIKYDFPLESISIQSLIVFNLGSMKSDESAFQWEFFWYVICFICLSPVQNCGGPDSFSLRLIVCMSSYAGNCTANRGPINLHLGPQSGTHTPRLWLLWIRCKSMIILIILWSLKCWFHERKTTNRFIF